MKTCSSGHQNSGSEALCSEFGWKIPNIHILVKGGKILKTVAINAMILLVVLHIGIMLDPSVTEGGSHELRGFYSWFGFLIGMGIATTVFWIGDYLKRSN